MYRRTFWKHLLLLKRRTLMCCTDMSRQITVTRMSLLQMSSRNGHRHTSQPRISRDVNAVVLTQDFCVGSEVLSISLNDNYKWDDIQASSCWFGQRVAYLQCGHAVSGVIDNANLQILLAVWGCGLTMLICRNRRLLRGVVNAVSHLVSIASGLTVNRFAWFLQLYVFHAVLKELVHHWNNII